MSKVDDSSAGEAFYAGQWVPSCRSCAKTLKTPWKECVKAVPCHGCGRELVSAWTVG